VSQAESQPVLCESCFNPIKGFADRCTFVFAREVLIVCKSCRRQAGIRDGILAFVNPELSKRQEMVAKDYLYCR
jgi:hypothetical protein